MAYILESIIAGSEYQASRMVRVHVFHILLFSYLVSLLLSNGEGRGKCPSSFNCGDLGTIQFPFTTIERPDCGILALHGCGDDSGIQLKEGELYDVIHIDHFTIFVRDYSLHKSLQSRSCEIFNSKFTPNLPPTSPLASFDMKYNVTMFRCDKSLHIPLPKLLFNYTNCSSYNIYYFRRKLELPGSYKPPSSFTGCSTIQLPVKNEDDNNDPFTFLTADVPIEVRLSDECAKCYHHDRGLCQLDSEGKFLCAKEDSRPVKKLIIIATATSAAGVAVLMMFLSCCFRRKIYSWTSLSFHKKENQMNKMIEVLLKENGHLPIRRYSYLEITKMTNSFKNKLGKGGYGTVYKGKLQDGRHVAVKVLHELKGSDEEFITEVAGISRTSHINIVSLLGFCFQGSKRALIYEFMSNGSLEKFINVDSAMIVDRQIDRKTLYDIAIGIARGLEYLHRGCNRTRILHLDVKPQNILLDEDLCPKISDFGLAKICPINESSIFISTARGTIGYIAPEVLSKNTCEISDKSDVYSYGMLLLEMIGVRKNINAQFGCSSEIYFPQWIYEHLELNQELGLQCMINDSDKQMVRKMTVVSLWCIQTNPAERPTMSEVVEMLEGNVESMQVPPKPFLSSASTSPANHTETNEILQTGIANEDATIFSSINVKI